MELTTIKSILKSQHGEYVPEKVRMEMYKAQLEKDGKHFSLSVCMEELTELSEALFKWRVLSNHFQNVSDEDKKLSILEETVDNIFVFDNLKVIFDLDVNFDLEEEENMMYEFKSINEIILNLFHMQIRISKYVRNKISKEDFCKDLLKYRRTIETLIREEMLDRDELNAIQREKTIKLRNRLVNDFNLVNLPEIE